MSYKWGNRSKKRLQGVSEILVECLTRALSISKYDMTIPSYGGKRTADQQNKLYKKGASQKDGYEKQSYHQTGNAGDAIPVDGLYANDKGFRHFAKCMFYTWQLMMKEGKIPEGYFLEWGGHWTNFIDMPHWQIVKR